MPESTPSRLAAGSTTPVRSTQSLVSIQANLWRRPALLARELAWRWLFGIPALLILVAEGTPLPLLLSRFGSDFAIALPSGTDASLHMTIGPIALPRVSTPVALLTLLLLGLGWGIASGVGRALLFRKLTTQSRLHTKSLIVLQTLRIAALATSWLLWAALVRSAAHATFRNLPAGQEPNIVGFAAWLIVLSLGSFTVWALWSWILSFASVLVVTEDRSGLSALAASVRQGRRLTMQLVEINLVLGIVKLALIVLAMVFSAIPLPFETVMTGNALHAWYAFVFVLYLAASDFFQLARLAAFLEFRKHHRDALS